MTPRLINYIHHYIIKCLETVISENRTVTITYLARRAKLTLVLRFPRLSLSKPLPHDELVTKGSKIKQFSTEVDIDTIM